MIEDLGLIVSIDHSVIMIWVSNHNNNGTCDLWVQFPGGGVGDPDFVTGTVAGSQVFGVALNALGFVGGGAVVPSGKSGSWLKGYFLGDVKAQDPVRFGVSTGIYVWTLGGTP